jgi:hypothetical protein
VNIKRIRAFLFPLTVAGLAIVGVVAAVQAQSSERAAVTAVQTGPGFTFQGQLRDNGSPVNDSCDVQASLWAAASGGPQVGSTQMVNNVAVQDGRFTITLNANNEFGADAFTGQARWLEIAVRCLASSGSYATLQPRQPLTAAPYAQSLLPGAVISGSVGAPTNAMLSLSNFDANGVGLRIPDSSLDGIFVDRAGRDGIFIGSTQRAGVWIDAAQEDGIFICATGNQTGCFPYAAKNGIEIDHPQDHGIFIGVAGMNGVDVAGNNLAGYFYGAVQITGGCTGCLLANFAINVGQTSLEVGDVVVLTGSRTSQVDSVPVLMEVTGAEGQGAVVGVVIGRAEEVAVKDPRPNELGRQLIPREGAAQPGDFVTIATYGLALVRVNSLDEQISVGQRLTAGENGRARTLQTVEVNGVTLNEAAPVLGIALESGDTDGDGLVWVLVNLN